MAPFWRWGKGCLTGRHDRSKTIWRQYLTKRNLHTHTADQVNELLHILLFTPSFLFQGLLWSSPTVYQSYHWIIPVDSIHPSTLPFLFLFLHVRCWGLSRVSRWEACALRKSYTPSLSCQFPRSPHPFPRDICIKTRIILASSIFFSYG